MTALHPLWALPVHPHLLFEALGWLAGATVAFLLRGRPDPAGGPAQRQWVVVGAVLGGLVGAKLLFVLTDPAFVIDPARWLAGKSVVGALLGGWIGVELAKVAAGITSRTGDRFVWPISVGIAVGRVGCFFSGVSDGTHGVETTLPVGMDLGDGLLRHPTALYEIPAVLALGALAHAAPARPGGVFRRWLGGYLLWRLLTEPLRTQPALFAGLTAIQGACLLGLAALLLEPILRRDR